MVLKKKGLCSSITILNFGGFPETLSDKLKFIPPGRFTAWGFQTS
jgi:hypothetical protein